MESARRSAGSIPSMAREAGALVFVLGGLNIAISACMINFNRYLMRAGHFPFPVTLVLLHMVFGSCLASALFAARPSLFRSLTAPDDDKHVRVNGSFLLRGVLPIAMLLSMQLVMGNGAYMHSSVPFLQMMKECNLVLVYVLSLVASLECFRWRNAGVLLCVVLATTATVRGEIHFSKTGFAIQATSQVFECSRVVIQAIVLSPQFGWKLDALSYLLVVMPLCAACLAMAMAGTVHFWPGRPQELALPDRADLVKWWPYLLTSCCLAFALNFVSALFLKASSAVGLMLTGVMKDVMIVTASSVVMGEVISSTQVWGFSAQVSLVLLWSLMKTFPKKFDDGIFVGLRRFLASGGDNADAPCLKGGEKASG